MRSHLRTSIDFKYLNIVFLDRAGRKRAPSICRQLFARRSRSGPQASKRRRFSTRVEVRYRGTGQDSGEGIRVSLTAEF
jgi:hypothetical protein